jgi:hypothetical protein
MLTRDEAEVVVGRLGSYPKGWGYVFMVNCYRAGSLIGASKLLSEDPASAQYG